ncbi:membrane protein [Thraustotheca clavata]|uniref:Membrane protein n=1 Tax=Thraustotheca clavata TaxID=74557 RepID=A0A1V9ZZ39_9STRA|nr:membrane protein [Thraustotheca clavata]
MNQAHLGVGLAVLAYLLWGFQPIYWKQLLDVNSYELILHRVVWSYPILIFFLAINGEFKAYWEAITTLSTYKVYTVSALLLGINFFFSLWAVNAGHILQMSLGYFVNPLVSVLLGVVFLKERLPTLQWVAIGIATIGVIIVTIGYGEFPWIALTIAAVFGFYGLVQKKAPLSGLVGCSVELLLLTVPCLIAVIVLEIRGTSAFGHSGATTNWLIVGCGAATILPQIAFVSCLKSITLSVLGIVQFLGPTIQTLVGVFMYDENFSVMKLAGFICVWISLVVFTIDGLRPKPKEIEDSPKVDNDENTSSDGNSKADYRADVDSKV